MALETKIDLNPETIDKLQDLIRINIDSFDGFKEAAEEVDDVRLKQLFGEMAEERSAQATELQNYVEWNGKDAEDDGSFSAAFHRAWIEVRSTLSGGDACAILSEAERGEDVIKDAYEDALETTAGSAMNDVLMAQYAKVKAGHDRIRDLRDACKED